MGACASSSRGGSNHGKNQKSAKVAALPSTPAAQTGPAAAFSAMDEKSSFTWRIDGVSSLLDKKEGWTNSGYFEIKGLKWYLKVNLKDRKSGDKKEYVSLALKLSKTSDLKPDMIVEASFKLLIFDQAFGRHSEHEFSHKFEISKARRSGVSCMIPVETLKEPSSGFIVGNSCIFGVELIKLTTAAEVKHDSETGGVELIKLTTAAEAKHGSETGRVQTTNGFSARDAYTWVIDDFLTLKGRCYSPEFEIGGRKWYLTMYPSGTDGNEEFLSLYLHMAKPSASFQSSEVLVELSLSIKDKVTSNRKTKTGRCQFAATEEEGDGWGWAKFVAVKHVKDWFLVKGSCLIEADVAILGPSKME